MDEWLFMEGHRCRGPWFMTHFTVPRNSFKADGPMPQKSNEGCPFFAAWGPLTKTSAFDFTYDHYDERKGVNAACDYCPYNG